MVEGGFYIHPSEQKSLAGAPRGKSHLALKIQ
jgi:hypothetical protein